MRPNFFFFMAYIYIIMEGYKWENILWDWLFSYRYFACGDEWSWILEVDKWDRWRGWESWDAIFIRNSEFNTLDTSMTVWWFLASRRDVKWYVLIGSLRMIRDFDYWFKGIKEMFITFACRIKSSPMDDERNFSVKFESENVYLKKSSKNH